MNTCIFVGKVVKDVRKVESNNEKYADSHWFNFQPFGFGDKLPYFSVVIRKGYLQKDANKLKDGDVLSIQASARLKMSEGASHPDVYFDISSLSFVGDESGPTDSEPATEEETPGVDF